MSSLPYLHTDRMPHGTRGAYVAGCRCDVCRRANTRYWHDLQLRSAQAVKDIPRAPGSVCPGWDGVPCPTQKRLRADSQGVCHRCRARAIWNGMVDAEPARRHIEKLSRAGVGYKQVAAAADVNHTTVRQVMTGRRKQLRKSSLEAILAVDEQAAADHGLIRSTTARQQLRELEPEYLTKRNLWKALGYAHYAAPIGRRITAKRAHRIAKLHRRVFGESE